MHFTTTIALSALSGLAIARDISVKVGSEDPAKILTFEPAEITAEEGDTVTFKFWPKNHSVAQSSFDAPCEPIENSFWSGFVPTSDTENAAEDQFVITIDNASRPIWFYCSAGQHCQNGMAGVINPPASGPNTLDAYKAAAADAENNVSPTSEAGTGGNITHTGHSEETPASGGESPSQTGSGASPSDTGAAASVAVGKGLMVTSLFALIGYLI